VRAKQTVPEGTTQAVAPLGQAEAGVCLDMAAAVTAAASCEAAVGAAAGGGIYTFVNAAVQCERTRQGSILSGTEGRLLLLCFLLPGSIGGLCRDAVCCCCC
jgi:hypothetical protein